jgi:hypothetical protein
MNFSHLDHRPTIDKEADLRVLNVLQEVLEAFIASYAIESPEDLYDEEHNEIIRKLEFSQGISSYCLVISPDGTLRMVNGNCPLSLLVEIHNALMTLVGHQEGN